MLRFAVVGIAATALHYLVYYLLLSVLNPNMAYTIGYAFSFVCNYFLSSVFTFRVAMSWQRLAAFALSHLLNYLIGLIGEPDDFYGFVGRDSALAGFCACGAYQLPACALCPEA